VFVRKRQTQQEDEKQVLRLKHLAQGKPDLDGLADALKSASLEVRTEAARLLGRVGDASSLPPLQEALLNSYTGRSPKLHRVLGVLETGGVFALGTVVIGALLVALVSVCSCFVPAFGGGTLPNPVEVWDSLSEHRRTNDPFIRAVLQSIEGLVEKHSAIELRPLLPALRTIAADRHHHRDNTRSAALNAIGSIEALTREVGELPIRSQAPEVDPSELPIAGADDAE
jgi:hypothetical protein